MFFFAFINSGPIHYLKIFCVRLSGVLSFYTTYYTSAYSDCDIAVNSEDHRTVQQIK